MDENDKKMILKKMKKSRAGYAANLTRLSNLCRHIMKDSTNESIEDLQLEKDKLIAAFEAFCKANRDIVEIDASLDMERDKRDEFELILYDFDNFLSNKSMYFNVNSFQNLHLSNATQHNNANSSSSNSYNSDVMNVVIKQFENIAKTIAEGFSLPKVEIKPFNGDPVTYLSFIHDFDANVACHTDDNAKRLALLINFCTGEARNAIETTKLLSPSVGYNTAKRILSERYGQSYVIARSFIDRIVNGEEIKANDTASLLNLASEMRNCFHCLSEIGNKADINSSVTLKQIVSRLPYNLKIQWIDRVGALRENGEEPDFEQLTRFLERKAKFMNDPVFGLSSFTSKKVDNATIRFSPKSNVVVNKPKSVSNYLTTNCDICVFCDNKGHSIENCFNFTKILWSDKIQFLRKKGYCFNCLKAGHTTMYCPHSKLCTVNQCTENRKHHTIMHVNSTKINISTKVESTESNYSSLEIDATENKEPCYLTSVKRISNLPIVAVEVNSEYSNESIITYAILDSGSDLCFCTDEIANLVKAKVEGNTKLAIKTISAVESFDSKLITLKIKGVNDSNSFTLSQVRTLPKREFSKFSPPNDETLKKWKHLEDIKLHNFDDCRVSMIIGANRPEMFVVSEYRIGENKSDPLGCLGPLGWYVIGGNLTKSTINELYLSENIDDLSEIVKKFWSIDSVGLLFSDQQPRSIEDRKALAMMESSAVLKQNNHYEISLPWRNFDVKLPDNKRQALVRFLSLKQRFKKDDAFYKSYQAEINNYLHNNYAEKIMEPSILNTKARVWYLPHHGVTNVNKPERVRVVFDCAAKYENVSLNSCLYSGPDLTNNLCSVLMRFRFHKVALVGDIKAMFCQVNVSDQDKDTLRFLWFDEDNLNSPIAEYRMLVHIFGATSSPACASYALRRTALDNESFSVEVRNAVNENFYVDDFLKSEVDTESGLKMINDLNKLTSLGGFEMHKWLSNDAGIINQIPVEMRANSLQSIDINVKDQDLPTERTLGLRWNSKNDCFEFKFKLDYSCTTKRSILSYISSIYDPIGFISPVVLVGKQIFQNITREHYSWDDEIDDQLKIKWRNWIEDLKQIEFFSLPRCVTRLRNGQISSAQLHCFSDASEVGLGCCCYLRVVYSSSVIESNLIMSKARLSPLKTQSIPRLELQSALLSSRLMKMVKESFRTEFETLKVYMWTDSTATLKFIMNEKSRFHVFVANRVAEIRTLTSVSDWRYIPTKLNPADTASRGCTVSKLSNEWLKGPSFLQEEESTWNEYLPLTEQYNQMYVDNEIKNLTTNLYIEEKSVRNKNEKTLDDLINYFSSWYRLKVAVSWFIRYKVYWKHKLRPEVKLVTGQLSSIELKKSEEEIIKYVQLNVFKKVNCESIMNLNPFITNGLMRVGGRLRHSHLKFASKHPIILPYRHHITELIIREQHMASGHSGQEHLLSLIREKFWIIKGRTAIIRVLKSCITCKRWKAKFVVQQMADLHPDRVIETHPFQNVGMDFFGPFFVRVGRSTVKRYCCVYTCFSIRAIHLEITHDLTSDSFLLSLRRFIARRGCPKHLYSDNGTNFTGAFKVLSSEVTLSNNVANFLKFNEIDWIFIPPKASHFGGIWERMIRTIRQTFNKVFIDETLTEESLSTIMSEIEFLVNSRPLTRNSDDVVDWETLTPNHFLLGKSVYYIPFNAGRIKSFRDQWQQVQKCLKMFWERWRKEYLTLLQTRCKWTKEQPNLLKGDIVLLSDSSVHRGQWPMAKVIEVIKSSDGLVRSVKLKTKANEEVLRPISKVVGLELSIGEEV